MFLCALFRAGNENGKRLSLVHVVAAQTGCIGSAVACRLVVVALFDILSSQ